jgi:hypothetical protein
MVNDEEFINAFDETGLFTIYPIDGETFVYLDEDYFILLGEEYCQPVSLVNVSNGIVYCYFENQHVFSFATNDVEDVCLEACIPRPVMELKKWVKE